YAPAVKRSTPGRSLSHRFKSSLMVFISNLFQQIIYINMTKNGAVLVYAEAIVLTAKYCSEKSL
ncbi:hypothetical protein ACP084_004233, partial [Klebsiella pneumoniae]